MDNLVLTDEQGRRWELISGGYTRRWGNGAISLADCELRLLPDEVYAGECAPAWKRGLDRIKFGEECERDRRGSKTLPTDISSYK